MRICKKHPTVCAQLRSLGYSHLEWWALRFTTASHTIFNFRTKIEFGELCNVDVDATFISPITAALMITMRDEDRNVNDVDMKDDREAVKEDQVTKIQCMYDSGILGMMHDLIILDIYRHINLLKLKKLINFKYQICLN